MINVLQASLKDRVKLAVAEAERDAPVDVEVFDFVHV